MNQIHASTPAFPLALFLFALALPLAAEAVPEKDATAAKPATDSGPQRMAIPPRAQRLKERPPAPLKHLTYSAREGFALRMVSNQDVTAEIRNGAGRTLAFTSRTLEAGNWTLRPRNLAPGLYTVWLRTGPNLRALRLKIEDAERGQGGPEWIVEKVAEKAPDSAHAPAEPPSFAR